MSFLVLSVTYIICKGLELDVLKVSKCHVRWLPEWYHMSTYVLSFKSECKAPFTPKTSSWELELCNYKEIATRSWQAFIQGLKIWGLNQCSWKLLILVRCLVSLNWVTKGRIDTKLSKVHDKAKRWLKAHWFGGTHKRRAWTLDMLKQPPWSTPFCLISVGGNFPGECTVKVL